MPVNASTQMASLGYSFKNQEKGKQIFRSHDHAWILVLRNVNQTLGKATLYCTELQMEET